MVFDCHSDLFTDVTVKMLKGEKNIIKNHHLKNLQKGGLIGGIYVIWIDPPYDKCPEDRAKQIVTALTEEIKNNTDIINQVKDFSDFEKGFKENKLNVLVGMEGLSHIGEDVDKLHYYHDVVGARHAMLTWNEQNALATGVGGDPSRGLTEAGKRAVKKLEELKMIVDVSHANEKSFWDIMDVATTPIMASHSNAKHFSSHRRTLTDDQIKAIAQTGGIIGMNGYKEFVDDKNPEEADVKRLVDHIDYIANLVGVEHIGCGFDYSGFIDPDCLAAFSTDTTNPNVIGLKEFEDTPNLITELQNRGYSKDDIEAIAYKNAFRVIKQVIGVPSLQY
ncbi:dipeptidase [Intestinibacter sp.]|uniref:dipeptidase n=1 Tax=Intestinibacter sp. TaxID=1965304 RepID=UPI003F15C81C